MTEHEITSDDLVAYACGELDAARRDDVEAALASGGSLAEEAARLTLAVEALGAEGEASLSPDFNARLRTRLDVELEATQARQPKRMSPSRPSSPAGHRGGAGAVVRRLVQPALLAAAVAACIVLATMLLVGSATPTWAQVAEQFASVRHFSVTVYHRKHALSEVEQVELWVGGGRVRAKSGNQVVFGHRGKVTRAFDVKQRKEVDAHGQVAGLLRMLGDREAFSIETVMAMFSGGALKDVTPKLSGEAVVAEDLAIYDMESPRTPEWCRIWALRKSRLPVRIAVWDPRDGACTEAVFTYGREPPEAFFDPQAFSKHLAERTISERMLPYIDLPDAGGQAFAPAVPEFAQAVTVVTPTLDGEPWSLKDRLGKVTVLQVWVPSEGGPQGIMHDRRWLMPLYEKYGQRDDFQIVTLAVFEDADRVREMKADQQIPWLFLHDGKRWQGELARALGGPQHSSLYLVDRQGQISELRDERLAEVELVGPTYENSHLLALRFGDAMRAGKLTVETVRTIFGEPDEVGDSPDGPGREQWTYVRRDDRQEQERRIMLHVDRQTGVVSGMGFQHLVLEPARLTLTITQEYWRDKVLPQIEAKYRPENDREDLYRLQVSLRKMPLNTVGYPFGVTQERKDFEPGTPLRRELPRGTYRLVVEVERRDPWGMLQTVVLKDALVLEKNSKTEIVLE